MAETKEVWKTTTALPAGASYDQMLEFFGVPPHPKEDLRENIKSKRRSYHAKTNSPNPKGRARAKEIEALIQRVAQTLLRGVPGGADGGGVTVELPDAVFETLDELRRIVTEYVLADDYDRALQVAREALDRLSERAEAAAVLAWVLATGFNTGSLINQELVAEGLTAADAALEGQPQVARNWESKISLLIAGSRPQEAAAALEEASKTVTGPLTARLYIMRARVAIGLGRTDEALLAAVRAVLTALSDADDVPAIRSDATDLLVSWIASNLLPIRSTADLARYGEMVGVAAWCAEGVPDAEDQVRVHRMWAANAGKRVFTGSWKLRSFLAVCTGFISLPIHNYLRSSPAWRVFAEGLDKTEHDDAFTIVASPEYVQRAHNRKLDLAVSA
jgi:tetratricopeptide (TPR) repeat protein